MKKTLIFFIGMLMLGCAAAPVVEEPPAITETAKEPALDITAVPAERDGVIAKLRGIAYIHHADNEEYVLLREGDTIPIGKLFYLAPKTTMRIDQDEREEIFLYSRGQESYYQLQEAK